MEIRRGRRARISTRDDLDDIEQGVRIRAMVRSFGWYDMADDLRKKLDEIGVTVRDGNGWTEWDLRL